MERNARRCNGKKSNSVKIQRIFPRTMITYAEKIEIANSPLTTVLATCNGYRLIRDFRSFKKPSQSYFAGRLNW